MGRLLQWLFFGHVHKWKTIEEVAYTRRRLGQITAKGSRFIQQCEHCGVVVKRDLI